MTVDLKIEMATNWLMGSYRLLSSPDTLEKGMIRVQGEMEQHGARFHCNIQNDTQLKTYGLFTSGMFQLIFFRLQLTVVTDAEESEMG